MTRDRQAGFTLLEMLISMTLLSLLLLALFGGLRFIGRGSDKVEALLDDSQRQDLARDLLVRSVGNLFPVTAGDKDAPQLLFTGTKTRLAFPILRLPGQGPAGLMLAVFDITREDGLQRLIYREYKFQPGARVAVADQPTRSTLLLTTPAPLSFRYLGKAGSWQSPWNDSAALPSLVALEDGDRPALMARPHAQPSSP